MKKPPKRSPKSKSSKKSARSSRAKAKVKPAAKAKLAKAKAKAKAKARTPAPKKAKAKARSRKASPRKAKRASPARWVSFVERHGVVLASARGPVPSVAEAIAGEPIVGSWWSHPKAPVIFDALSSIDDSDDVRSFKLVDHKITFVHRSRWPALARLAGAGMLESDRVASIQQEHMPTGEHRNFTTPYPDWVPEDVAAAASELTVEDARAQLGSWL